MIAYLFARSMYGFHIFVDERYIHLTSSNSLLFHVSRRSRHCCKYTGNSRTS